MATGAEGPGVRNAATVIVLRDRGGDAEVLLLRRHRSSGFAANAWVFPGGVVDRADRELDLACWRGIDPERLAPRFRRDPDLVLGMHVAAVRETFEEAGLLLGSRPDGTPADPAAKGVRAMRHALASRTARPGDFARWVADQDLVLDLSLLTYWARWITPRLEAKRYDTCFFVARVPEGQVAEHDRVETVDGAWSTARDALDAHARGDLHLIYPTVKTLEELAVLGGADAVVAHAIRRPEVPAVLPHIEVTSDGWRIVHPDEPGYPAADYADELAAVGARPGKPR